MRLRSTNRNSQLIRRALLQQEQPTREVWLPIASPSSSRLWRCPGDFLSPHKSSLLQTSSFGPRTPICSLRARTNQEIQQRTIWTFINTILGLGKKRTSSEASALEIVPDSALSFKVATPEKMRESPLLHRPLYPPGIPIIYQLTTYLDRKIGSAPSVGELIEAFYGIVEWYNYEGLGRKITDEHTFGLLRVYEYLERRNAGLGQSEGVQFTLEALRALLKLLQNTKSEHEERLGAYIFYDICRQSSGGVPTAEDYNSYIKLLSSRENFDEIFALSTDTLVEEMMGGPTSPIDKQTWREIIHALSNRPDRDDYSLENLSKYGIPIYDPERNYEILYLAKAGDWEMAYEYYTRQKSSDLEFPLATYEDVIEVCERHGELDKANEVLGDLIAKTEREGEVASGSTNAQEKRWQAILRWVSIIRGVGSVKELLQKLMDDAASQEKRCPRPDIDLLNRLVEFALSRKDEKLASQLLQLSSEELSPPRIVISLPCPPNRKTRSLKLRVYVQMEEIERARGAYKLLQTEYDLPGKDVASEEASLLLWLIGTKRHPKARDIETTSLILADLHERNIPLNIHAISSLVQYYLNHNHFPELIQLCETNIQNAILSFGERKLLIDRMIKYINSPKASILAAWDSYQILHRNFPLMEITPGQRIQLMDLFFTLSRSDLAAIIFLHTEQLWASAAYPPRPPKDPDFLKKTPILNKDYPSLLTSSVSRQLTPAKKEELYIHVLKGLSSGNRDLQTLNLVHNHLKTDPHMSPIPSTRLLNALMAAYAQMGMYERAIRFWGTIRRSEEGPDADSISLIFGICGRRNEWLEHGKKIWEGMRRMKIQVSGDNLGAYVEMVGRNGEAEEGWKVVREMMESSKNTDEKKASYRLPGEEETAECCGDSLNPMLVNEPLITALYNWLPREYHLEIESWIVKFYPQLYEQWVFIHDKPPQIEMDKQMWDVGVGDEEFGEFGDGDGDDDDDYSWR